MGLRRSVSPFVVPCYRDPMLGWWVQIRFPGADHGEEVILFGAFGGFWVITDRRDRSLFLFFGGFCAHLVVGRGGLPVGCEVWRRGGGCRERRVVFGLLSLSAVVVVCCLFRRVSGLFLLRSRWFPVVVRCRRGLGGAVPFI